MAEKVMGEPSNLPLWAIGLMDAAGFKFADLRGFYRTPKIVTLVPKDRTLEPVKLYKRDA